MARTRHMLPVLFTKGRWTAWTPIFVVGLGLALLVPGAAADDHVVRAQGGGRIGTVDRIDHHTFVLHDRDGRRLGTLTPTPGGDLVINDRLGRRLGTVAPQKDSAAILRDRVGRRTGSGAPR